MTNFAVPASLKPKPVAIRRDNGLFHWHVGHDTRDWGCFARFWGQKTEHGVRSGGFEDCSRACRSKLLWLARIEVEVEVKGMM